MKLQELLKFDDIVVQCHDNPDADALASGFAVYRYLKQHGKHVSLIYGGRNAIRKCNLVLMVNELDIPIEHVTELDEPELLVTVDCQYGEGNVSYFPAKQVAVLDHHRVTRELPELSLVKSWLGSCSTLLWDMLKMEGIDVNADVRLATALYYGLYSDTGAFSTIAHPLDRELRDQAAFDPQLITTFRNANMSIEELQMAGSALLNTDYLDEYRCAITKVGLCDPNILGIISDLVLEVDAVDVCVVFSICATEVKVSVRSCVKEIQADEFVSEITKGIGSGGGNIAKGGGTLYMDHLLPEYREYCSGRGMIPRMVLSEDGETERLSDSIIKSVLTRRIASYFEDFRIICAREERPRHTGLHEYHGVREGLYGSREKSGLREKAGA